MSYTPDAFAMNYPMMSQRAESKLDDSISHIVQSMPPSQRAAMAAAP
jgi:hypothetical protein